MDVPAISPYLRLERYDLFPWVRFTLNSFLSKLLNGALVVISTAVVSTTEKRISPVSLDSIGSSSFVQETKDNMPIKGSKNKIYLFIISIIYIKLPMI